MILSDCSKRSLAFANRKMFISDFRLRLFPIPRDREGSKYSILSGARVSVYRGHEHFRLTVPVLCIANLMNMTEI